MMFLPLTYRHTEEDSPSITEQNSPLWLGMIGHFGPAIAYIATLLLIGITPLNAILAYGSAVIFLPFTFWLEKHAYCVALPKSTIREIISGYSLVFIKGITIGGTFIAIGWYCLSLASPYKSQHTSWLIIFFAVFLTDMGYYVIHRLMSHSRSSNALLKFYRKQHAAHHTITHLDFLRGNESSVIDTAFSQIQPCLILVSWLFGMSLEATLVTYAIVVLMQTTDHANHTFNIGWLRFIFLDNHVHKLHHCRRGSMVNFGAVFSVFDIMFGTYYENATLNGSYMHHHNIPLPLKRRQH